MLLLLLLLLLLLSKRQNVMLTLFRVFLEQATKCYGDTFSRDFNDTLILPLLPRPLFVLLLLILLHSCNHTQQKNTQHIQHKQTKPHNKHNTQITYNAPIHPTNTYHTQTDTHTHNNESRNENDVLHNATPTMGPILSEQLRYASSCASLCCCCYCNVNALTTCMPCY